MNFGLYDENGYCRANFDSNKTKEENLQQLEYEEYCCRVRSNDYEYCKNTIESWYGGNRAKETISERKLNEIVHQADLNREIIRNKYADIILKLYGHRILECYRNSVYLSRSQIEKALRCYYNIKD